MMAIPDCMIEAKVRKYVGGCNIGKVTNMNQMSKPSNKFDQDQY